MRHLRRLAAFESASAIDAIEHDRLKWGGTPAAITPVEMGRLRAVLPGWSLDWTSEPFEETARFSSRDGQSTVSVSKGPGLWLLSAYRRHAAPAHHSSEELSDILLLIKKHKRLI